MSGVVLPFRGPVPTSNIVYRGTVCVMGDKAEGFEVAHESESGNSWGNFSGPYPTGQAAIAAAYALNRDEYRGQCDVQVCQAALDDRDGVTRREPFGGEDF